MVPHVSRVQNKFVYLEQKDRGMDKTNFTEFYRAERKYIHTSCNHASTISLRPQRRRYLIHTYMRLCMYVYVSMFNEHLTLVNRG